MHLQAYWESDVGQRNYEDNKEKKVGIHFAIQHFPSFIFLFRGTKRRKFNLPVTYSTSLPNHQILDLFILGEKYSDVGRKYYTLQKEKNLDSCKRPKNIMI